MLSVQMSNLWSDDKDEIVKGVREAIKNIASYYNNENTTRVLFKDLLQDIKDVCNFWTGKTYVGNVKENEIKDVFQNFFVSFMELLLKLKKSRKRFEYNFANSVLYRGKAYRCLGNDSPGGQVVHPIYDCVYVSWSKEPNNSYFMGKLYGDITLLSCEIDPPLYGIDLEGLGCSRAKEREVVFPTIKKSITEIKYTSNDDEDNLSRDEKQYI